MYRKINLKSVLIGFVVLWLFAHGFKILGYLYNIEMAEEVRAGTFDVTGRRFEANELVVYSVLPFYAYNLGYFVGFLACFILSDRKRNNLIEALITLIVFIAISLLGLTNWNNHLKYIFLAPGAYLDGIGYFLLNGMVMLIIGICLLFVKKRITSNKGNSQLKQHYA